ncbi:MAG: hypothetical protein HGB22_04515 [Chlorobiaceae bacterium]|nr:hypothetical protein [Chlorobiaceae bacterium]
MRKNAIKIAVLTAASLGAGSAPALARVDVDLHLGSPGRVIVVPEPPPPPRHRFHIENRPRFLYTPPLGFYVSVDGPYDIVYYEDRYYVYDDGRWYWSSEYNGPWDYIDDRRLPGRLRRFRHEEIRRYRDHEYRRYRDDERYDRGPRDHRGPHNPDRWR